MIQGEGIEVTIPPNAIDPGDEVPITIQACLKGPFKLTHETVPITPVYLLYPPCVFHRKVTLKFKVFADIESDDQIIFVTSEDKRQIRRDQPVWRFREDPTAIIQSVPGGREVTVEVGHFCFGFLARRRRRGKSSGWYTACIITVYPAGQHHFYVICLYKPSVLLSTCHTIFAASLDHEVYKNVSSPI